MVPSVDTYIQKEVTNMLDIMLNECYIIDEVLRDFDAGIVSKFKEAYCGSNPKHEVTVRHSFPDVKQPLLASYIVELGDGTETKDSLGGIEGAFTSKEDGYEQEQCTIYKDDGHLVIKTSKPIARLEDIKEISFAESDGMHYEGNIISFVYEGNELLDGMTVNVSYSSKYEASSDNEPQGTHRGFTATEAVNITAISNNVDTVRCLDAILKAILIIMRQNPQEQNYYGLQRMRFSGIAPVIRDGDTIVHGRTATLTYTISYSVDYDVAQNIKEFVLKGAIKFGKQE